MGTHLLQHPNPNKLRRALFVCTLFVILYLYCIYIYLYLCYTGYQLHWKKSIKSKQSRSWKKWKMCSHSANFFFPIQRGSLTSQNVLTSAQYNFAMQFILGQVFSAEVVRLLIKYCTYKKKYCHKLWSYYSIISCNLISHMIFCLTFLAWTWKWIKTFGVKNMEKNESVDVIELFL